ncbi:LOW QUALITY PROTEIN: hypothetical protein Cgig2_000263 [Carnegiea gigantea]|uniref:Uncharacterized protein n=1 Tax=Carnegiea gigantea TaxID=171969 RepID=A0A9Q1GGL4_9CARY|nr:LOW QUALITY PROTEIN: hypothetical protein Cgig2_033976 [Carnegiea gigantea]KAJ8424051.1 LOW QUALITY PROTEIN: hypothetical protein Cgig2_000263 [Carnegiea gigantea]
MGKKTTASRPTPMEAPKRAKTGASSSVATNAPPSRAQAARDNRPPLPPHGGRVFINHNGQVLYPLPKPTKTNCADASNWVYDDDIDAKSDEKRAQPQGGNVGGSVGGSGIQDGFRGGTPEEEMYEPPLAKSRAEASSSGFNEAQFYQYMDDDFSRLNLRLDAIDEWQSQAAQDQSEMLRRQMEFDCRQHYRLL